MVAITMDRPATATGPYTTVLVVAPLAGAEEEAAEPELAAAEATTETPDGVPDEPEGS
jgi:hypothetical protein